MYLSNTWQIVLQLLPFHPWKTRWLQSSTHIPCQDFKATVVAVTMVFSYLKVAPLIARLDRSLQQPLINET
ncbi:hypothetical protein ECG_06418 [Echinococcus granulosus]|nr:hypothetical protein ECG_06418 [Echinococcus granulosus]